MVHYPEGTRIGLLGDSHGDAAITRRAIAILLEAGAKVLIFLGDAEKEGVIDALAGETVHLVFGNCDWDRSLMGEYAISLGILVDDPMGGITVGEKTILFAHGDDSRHEFNAVSADTDYFCHGHTHEVRDEKINSTRLLNPGALFRAFRYTVAWLDPLSGEYQVLEVPRD